MGGNLVWEGGETVVEYSVSDKMNISLQRLMQEKQIDFLTDLSKDARIIHRSLWALTIKDGHYVYKIYYYNNPEKIEKEVILLQNMQQIPIQLLYDRNGIYYTKSVFLELQDITLEGNMNTLVEQISYWCEYWEKAEEFRKHACCNWHTQTVPYMVNMLTLYGEEAERHKEYLNSLQEEVFIHGDLTVDNVKKAGDEMIIFDFETASIGPKMWDKTTFVYSLVEKGYTEFGRELFNLFECDKRMLECIASTRLAIARRKNKNHIQRELAYSCIKKF